MKCPSCGAVNPDDKSFCGDCGAPLARRCSACGAESVPGKKFCGECGAALAAAEAPPPAPATTPEAERRQLTVMFVDLVGSTELAGRLDPEDLREVMRRYQDAVAGTVTRYGGHVAKYLGDGVLAYFGWPRAHEDEAERSVRAGLAAVAAVSGLKLDAGIELRARVGIATGQIVIGDLMGEAGVISGETPNLAARLQDAAASGEVVIGAATRRLIGEAFELVDLGSRALKGFAEAVPMWRVTRERAAESRFEAAHAGRLTAFVGREEEVDLLARRWQQAKGGEGQVVLLSGEAGIGKSRIAQTLSDRIADQHPVRLPLQCSPHHANSALYPFISHLERASGFVPGDGPEARLDKLEALLARATEDVARVVPLMGALFSVPLGDRFPPLELTPPLQKLQTLEALADQLLGLAARRPVLMIIEDVHWADPTTLEALELVIDRVQGARVLVVITFRPEFAPPWHGHAHVTALALNRLGRDQCAAMVPDVARGKALPVEVLDQIVAKTDGVPLFVEELTKTVIESGILEEKAERYELTGPLPPLAIPSTLQDSLMARLDRLAPVKEVAQIGATIGREFRHELVAAVSSLGNNELNDALGQLVESELVFRRGGPPDATYVFKHALVQDAAYESLLKSKRQALHQRIAESFEESFPETVEAEPEILAHHYTEAGLAEPAIAHWQRAGRRAAENSANPEAVAHLRKGLDAIHTLAQGPETDRLEAGLQIALGPALMAARGFTSEEVEQAYTRARELCERTSDDGRLVTTLFGLWQMNNVRGEVAKARGIAGDLLDLAQRQRDSGGLLQAHHANWTSAFFSGIPDACRHHTGHGIDIYDPVEHHAHKYLYGAHDPGMCSRLFRGMSDWVLGSPEEAVRMGEQCLAAADRTDHPSTLVLARLFVAMVHLFRRDPERVAALTESSLALCAKHGFATWGPMNRALLGWAHAGQGGAGAVAEMRRGMEDWLASGTSLLEPWFLALEAEADGRAGAAQAGLDKVAGGLATGERTGEHWYDAELHRIRGELVLARSARHQDEAAESFGRALDIARAQEAKGWELRAATALARLWRDQGKLDDAREALAPVYGWFTEGLDTPDLKDAKAILDELG